MRKKDTKVHVTDLKRGDLIRGLGGVFLVFLWWNKDTSVCVFRALGNSGVYVKSRDGNIHISHFTDNSPMKRYRDRYSVVIDEKEIEKCKDLARHQQFGI